MDKLTQEAEADEYYEKYIIDVSPDTITASEFHGRVVHYCNTYGYGTGDRRYVIGFFLRAAVRDGYNESIPHYITVSPGKSINHVKLLKKYTRNGGDAPLSLIIPYREQYSDSMLPVSFWEPIPRIHRLCNDDVDEEIFTWLCIARRLCIGKDTRIYVCRFICTL